MKKIFALSFTLLSLISCSDDDNNSNVAPIDTISQGSIFGTPQNPLNVGGPNQQNQVFVDLSGETAIAEARDKWDLGFYSGDDFRVVINGAVMMAVKQLETSDITMIQAEDPTVAVGTFDASNMAYVDNPSGQLSGTAFGTLATDEETAKVYLVNLGKQVPTAAPEPGSTNVAGDARGWKKVKIWRDGSAYKMQYADLASSQYEEVTIAKDPAYNHVFFNLENGSIVQSEPQKDKWDMTFTTFTNEVFDNDQVSAGAYFYSDYILINSKAGVTAFMVQGDAAAYEAFDMAALNTGDFAFSSDQRAIGESWRSVFERVVYDNVFYLVKDTEGNIYKVKFISMLNAEGHRGFPVFRYELLQ